MPSDCKLELVLSSGAGPELASLVKGFPLPAVASTLLDHEVYVVWSSAGFAWTVQLQRFTHGKHTVSGITGKQVDR